MNELSIVVSESYKGTDTTGGARGLPFHDCLDLLGFYTNSHACLSDETKISDCFDLELALSDV
jgi:hypothetical protein